MKYKLHYIDKISVPVSGEVIRGGAYHKAVEFAYRIKRDYPIYGDVDVCPHCGYEQPAVGDNPPDKCPKCGK